MAKKKKVAKKVVTKKTEILYCRNIDSSNLRMLEKLVSSKAHKSKTKAVNFILTEYSKNLKEARKVKKAKA